MASTIEIREWAPLWAVPVVPITPGTPPAQAVQESFPGDTTHFAVRRYRSVQAALLVPTSTSAGEASLPVPLLALVALGRRRRGDGVYQFPTSRGYDCYRFSSGRLSAIWTVPDRDPEARDVPLPSRPGKLRRLRPRRPASGRRGRGVTGTTAVTALLLIMALALGLTGGSGTDVSSPSEAERQQPDLIEGVVVDLNAATAALEEIMAVIPEARLTSLRVDPQGTTVRLWSPLATDRTMALLESRLEAGHQRRWSLRGSEITLEVANE